MKKLFLSSYFSTVAKMLPDFAGEELVGKKVVFIPTASLVEKVTFYVGVDKKALEKLGLVVDELEVSTATPQEIKNKIANSDIIFVAGGNTFFLLQELKRTGTDKLLTEQIENGKLYIGSSAGSVIACPNIEHVKHMDDLEEAPKLDGDFSSMAVVDFYVVPHATNSPFKSSAEKIVKEYSGKLDLRLISNNQVVTVSGNDVEVLELPPRKSKA